MKRSRNKPSRYPYQRMTVGQCVVLKRMAVDDNYWNGAHYTLHEKAMRWMRVTRGYEFSLEYRAAVVVVKRVK